MEGVTIKNLIFTFDTQMLRKAQHDKVGFFRQKAGCSTDVENSRQIGVYLKKQTQSGVVRDYAGQVSKWVI